MFRRKPFGSDIDRVDREIAEKEKQSKHGKWQEQASFLRQYSQTDMPIMAQTFNDMIDGAIAASGNDPSEQYASEKTVAGVTALLTYFDRVPEGSKRIDDPNIIRSMDRSATMSYTARVGLPNLNAIWTVYAGVAGKRQLLPFAQCVRCPDLVVLKSIANEAPPSADNSFYARHPPSVSTVAGAMACGTQSSPSRTTEPFQTRWRSMSSDLR